MSCHLCSPVLGRCAQSNKSQVEQAVAHDAMRCSYFTAWHGFSLVEGFSTVCVPPCSTVCCRLTSIEHLTFHPSYLTPFFGSKHLLLFYDHCYPLLLKVIGGELQERLIPVPYSKSSTDQAVSRFPTFILVRSIDRSCYFRYLVEPTR